MIYKRRKILMLIPELGYGGAEKSFLRLSHFLSKYHDVQIAVFQQHYAKGNYAQSKYNLTVPITILDNKKNIGRFQRWKNRWKNLRLLKKNSDITISFLTGANILNASVFGKSKTVVSMRGSRHFDPSFSLFKRLIYEFFIDPLTFMFSDRIISISEGLSNELKRYLTKKTKQKVQTIEVFVNTKELFLLSKNPIEKELEKLKGEPIIISAGRLSPEKGFEHLIYIFKDIYQKNNKSKLILIGDGPQYKELIILCKKLQLVFTKDPINYKNSSIIFLGYRKDPSRYFHIAKVFVLSSLTEGFSNAIIEALSTGITIVSTNCPWGPRSILCKKPKDTNIPYPTKVPLTADFGLLMPRIDDMKFKDLWVDTLSRKLLDSIDSKTKNLGYKRVYDFDVKIIGKKWLTLINELK